VIQFERDAGRGSLISGRAGNHNLPLRQPIDVRIAPPVSGHPPAAPFGGSKAEVILWSLRLRYRVWWNDGYKGPKPDVRIFVSCFDPAACPRLAHSTGLQKGLRGSRSPTRKRALNGAFASVRTRANKAAPRRRPRPRAIPWPALTDLASAACACAGPHPAKLSTCSSLRCATQL